MTTRLEALAMVGELRHLLRTYGAETPLGGKNFALASEQLEAVHDFLKTPPDTPECGPTAAEEVWDVDIYVMNVMIHALSAAHTAMGHYAENEDDRHSAENGRERALQWLAKRWAEYPARDASYSNVLDALRVLFPVEAEED